MKYFKLPVLFFLILIFCGTAKSQMTDSLPFLGDAAGIVNGIMLTRAEYITEFSNVTQQAPAEKKHTLSEQELADAHRKTWQNLVLKAIIEDSIERLRIVVTDQDVWDTLANDPPQFLKGQFTDSAGMFHKKDYLRELHNPVNDTLVHTLIKMMAVEIRRQKFADVLLARVPKVTDDELWREYKDHAGATRKDFEAEKEKLRSDALQKHQQAYMSNWVETAKKNATIIDYRTMK